MLTRDRVATITKLAFPVAIALSSSLLMSLVDLAMVGALGNTAIAAVGLSAFSNSLVLAAVAGLAPAVQGLIARRRGEGSKEPKCLPLNAGLSIALIVGVPLTILFYALSPFLFSLISSDPAVTAIGVPYLRMLYTGIIAVGMLAACKGFWSAVERPNTHMLIVLFINCLNILGNYAFIYGNFGAPALGAPGAALSTVLSLYVGVIINLVLISKRFPNEGFLKAIPGRALYSRIAQMGVPGSVQEFFFAAGFVVFLWLVGKIGTEDLAAMNVLVRISLVMYILANALGVASATLVSRTMGEGNPDGAAQWGWDAGKVGLTAITLLGLPLVLFPRFFLSLFFNDPHTIEIAVIPLRLMAGTSGLASLISIFAYTLVSLGDGARVAMISFGTQWLFFLPAVWFVGPYLGYGILQITFVDMVYGGLSTALITAIWAQGKWKRIAV